MIVVQSPHIYGSLPTHCMGLTPVMFVIMEVGIGIDGLGIPIPAWLQDHSPDCSAYYQLNAAAESILNALPQSVVQTTLYLRGNTSDGTGQYIDTWLFSYSIVASLLSVLKTNAFLSGALAISQHLCMS